MKYRQCNRCGEKYRPKYGGLFELTRGSLNIDAQLCGDCYDDMVVAYNEN